MSDRATDSTRLTRAGGGRVWRVLRRFRWTLGATGVLLVVGGWWATREPSLEGTGLERAWSSRESHPLGNAGGGLLLALRMEDTASPSELVAIDWQSGNVIQTIHRDVLPSLASPLGKGAVLAVSFPATAAGVRYWPGPGHPLQPLADATVTGNDYRRLAPPDDPGLPALRVTEPTTLTLGITRDGEDRIETFATMATLGSLSNPGVVTRVRVSGDPPTAGAVTREYVTDLSEAAKDTDHGQEVHRVFNSLPTNGWSETYGVPADELDALTLGHISPGNNGFQDFDSRSDTAAILAEERRNGRSAWEEVMLWLSGRRRVVNLGVYTRADAGERRTAFYRGGPLTPSGVGGRLAQLIEARLSEDGRFVGLSALVTTPAGGSTELMVFRVVGREAP